MGEIHEYVTFLLLYFLPIALSIDTTGIVLEETKSFFFSSQ